MPMPWEEGFIETSEDKKPWEEGFVGGGESVSIPQQISSDVSFLETPLYYTAVDRAVQMPEQTSVILDEVKRVSGIDLRQAPYNQAWARDTGILAESFAANTKSNMLKSGLADRGQQMPTTGLAKEALFGAEGESGVIPQVAGRLGHFITTGAANSIYDMLARGADTLHRARQLSAKRGISTTAQQMEQEGSLSPDESKAIQVGIASAPIEQQSRAGRIWSNLAEIDNELGRKYILPKHEPKTQAQNVAAWTGDFLGYMALATANPALVAIKASDETFEKAKEYGLDNDTAFLASVPAGVVYAALEKLQLNHLAKTLPDPIRKQIADKVLNVAGQKFAQTVMAETGKKTAKEAITEMSKKGLRFTVKHSSEAAWNGTQEVLQSMTQELAAAGLDTSKINWDEYKKELKQEFVAGGAVYGIMRPIAGAIKLAGSKKAMADFEVKQAKLQQENRAMAQPDAVASPVFAEQVRLSGEAKHPIIDPQVSVVLDQAAQYDAAAQEETDPVIRKDLKEKAKASREVLSGIVDTDTIPQVAAKEQGVNDRKDAPVKRAIQGQIFKEIRQRYKELGLPDNEAKTVELYAHSLAEQITGVRSLKNAHQTADGFQTILNTLRANNKHIFTPTVTDDPKLSESLASARKRLVDTGLLDNEQWGEFADKIGIFRSKANGEYVSKRQIDKPRALEALRNMAAQERILIRQKNMEATLKSPDVAGIKKYDEDLAMQAKTEGGKGFSRTKVMRDAMFEAEEKTGLPFGELHLDLIQNKADTRVEQAAMVRQMQAIANEGVDINDTEVTKRVASALQNNKVAELNPAEQKLAQFFQTMFQQKTRDIQADALWKSLGGEESSLGDKADKYIEIYANEGLDAAQAALFQTQDGLRKNYFPLFLKRAITAKGGKGIKEGTRSKARKTEGFEGQDIRTPLESALSYSTDVGKMRMSKLLHEFDMMVIDAKDKLLGASKEGSTARNLAEKRLNQQVNRYKQTMQGGIEDEYDTLNPASKLLNQVSSATIRTAFFADPTKPFRNRLQEIALGYGIDMPTGMQWLTDTKLSKADADFMSSNVFQDEGLQDALGARMSNKYGKGPIRGQGYTPSEVIGASVEKFNRLPVVRQKNILVDALGMKLNAKADMANRRDSMILGIRAAREAAIDTEMKYGPDWTLNRSAVKDFMNSPKMVWLDDMNVGMKRHLLRVLADEGLDGFARRAALFKTQMIHGDYNSAERSFIEQATPSYLRRLTVYPGLVARRLGKPVGRLLSSSTPMPQRLRAANDIMQMIIKTYLLGYIFEPLGAYNNPYSFVNTLASAPGSIAGDFIGNFNDILQAITSGEMPKAATLVDRMSNQLMPVKKMLWRVIDHASGQKDATAKFFTGKLDKQKRAQKKKDEVVIDDVLDLIVYYSSGQRALKRSKEQRNK